MVVVSALGGALPALVLRPAGLNGSPILFGIAVIEIPALVDPIDPIPATIPVALPALPVAAVLNPGLGVPVPCPCPWPAPATAQGATPVIVTGGGLLRSNPRIAVMINNES